MATLQVRLADLATRVASECKSIRTLINGNAADLSALTTTAKGNIVAAINELKSAVDLAASTGGAIINDGAQNTTQAWSSDKIYAEIVAVRDALVGGAPGALDALNELAAAIGNDANFAATMSASLAARVRHDTASQGLTAPQQANARTNIGAQAAADIGDTDNDLVAVFTTGLT
jgi:hypothetical protein